MKLPASSLWFERQWLLARSQDRSLGTTPPICENLRHLRQPLQPLKSLILRAIPGNRTLRAAKPDRFFGRRLRRLTQIGGVVPKLRSGERSSNHGRSNQRLNAGSFKSVPPRLCALPDHSVRKLGLNDPIVSLPICVNLRNLRFILPLTAKFRLYRK